MTTSPAWSAASQLAGRLLLADESTGNLDSARSGEVLAMHRRFNRERGRTTIVVTHDPAVAASTDRVIHMRDGLIEEGTSLPVRPALDEHTPREELGKVIHSWVLRR